jgi:hypothetical protein
MVDIVDIDNISVPNPSSSMNPTSVTIGSQIVNGTFSSVYQKIRIRNATSNPRWSLTLAPDGGPTSLWQGTGQRYDFNDNNLGAVDGPDSDTAGGKMTINPSV